MGIDDEIAMRPRCDAVRGYRAVKLKGWRVRPESRGVLRGVDTNY